MLTGECRNLDAAKHAGDFFDPRLGIKHGNDWL
jgi:hypothetical protein